MQIGRYEKERIAVQRYFEYCKVRIAGRSKESEVKREVEDNDKGEEAMSLWKCREGRGNVEEEGFEVSRDTRNFSVGKGNLLEK